MYLKLVIIQNPFCLGATSQCCALYGPGTGDIVFYDLQCSGNESSLIDCPHSSSTLGNCDHGDDVGVTCPCEYNVWYVHVNEKGHSDSFPVT